LTATPPTQNTKQEHPSSSMQEAMSAFFPPYYNPIDPKDFSPNDKIHIKMPSFISSALRHNDPMELVVDTKFLAWHYLPRSALFKDGQLREPPCK
jgi:hypothetical protein